jgi:protein-S-isoprenylcysteine O-methyltransferase Ste14
VETPNHPVSEKKVFPARELDCVQCYNCETKCPVKAIRTNYPGSTGWRALLEWLFVLLFFFQIIGGVIYGVWFGSLLGLQAFFYVGWLVLVLGFLFLLSSLIYFSKRGKPIEERNIMATTVLVESGTYGIVRHPQFLGAQLMICAAILITQHWLFALIGVYLLLSFVLSKWVQASEEHLIAKFGDDYKHYMEKVPRMNFLLGIIRLLRRRKKERI